MLDLTFLELKLSGATPEIRFFLIAYIREFGYDAEVDFTVKELAKRLGVTSHVVTAAIKFLLKGELFSIEKLPSGCGRPRTRYVCTARLKSDLEGATSIQGVCHRKLIDQLFRNRDDYKSDRSLLSTSNKILLSVLLYFADELGVVRNLKRSNLQELTGMSRDRLRSQVRKLLKSEFIRSYSSEVTGMMLFGASAEICFLNLMKFKKGNSSGVVVGAWSTVRGKSDIYRFRSNAVKVRNYKEIISSSYRSKRDRFKAKRSIERIHIDVADDLCITVDTVDCWMSSLDKQFTSAFTRYVIKKVNEYASYLLSKSWRPFLENDYDELVQKLKDELSDTSSNDRSLDQENIDRKCEAGIAFVCCMAFRLAQHVYQLQSAIQNEKFDFSTMSQVILPDPQNFGAITVELHSDFGGEVPGQWILFGDDPVNEEDIWLKDKYFYGLLTAPLKGDKKSLTRE